MSEKVNFILLRDIKDHGHYINLNQVSRWKFAENRNDVIELTFSDGATLTFELRRNLAFEEMLKYECGFP